MIEPWSKFFWSDYDADEGLRLCSLAAQGLWMRMLCVMARATPKGELRVGGAPCTAADLARAVGESEATVTRLMDELKRRGVFSVTRAGVVYSRRIRKDADLSKKRAAAGRKGGLASLGKAPEPCSSKKEAKAAASGEASAEARPAPQSPESRLPVSDETAAADAARRLFDLGVELLTATGLRESSARSLIGKWRKGHGDAAVLSALIEARARAVSNPVEWITRRLAAGAQAAGQGAPSSGSADYLDFVRRRYAGD